MSGDATATSIVRPPRPNNLLSRVWRRLQAWKTRFQMDNRLVGRLIELRGNRVRLHGLRISVDNPSFQEVSKQIKMSEQCVYQTLEKLRELKGKDR